MPSAATRPVRLILTSDDLSTSAPFVIYDAVTQDVITFTPGMSLHLYILSVSNGDTAAVVTVFDDKDGDTTVDAGEQIFKKSMNAKEQAGFALTRAFPLIRLPRAIASAGSANTAIFIYGELFGTEPVITIKPLV